MRYLAVFLIFFSVSAPAFAASFTMDSVFYSPNDVLIFWDPLDCNLGVDQFYTYAVGDQSPIDGFTCDELQNPYPISAPNLIIGDEYVTLIADDICSDFDTCSLVEPSSLFYWSYEEQSQNQTWGNSGLFGGTNVAAAVASGVQNTGASIWPLLLFVGVFLAFGIAIMVQDFIMQAGQKKREKYYSDLANSKSFEEDLDVMKKNGRI